MSKSHRTKSLQFIATSLFGALTIWWLVLQFTDPSSFSLEVFSGVYGIMALVGGIIGIHISKLWGGTKSQLGRAIFVFSLGLLAQEFGQITYSIYSLGLGVEIPYPSIGDIGYFGSVLLYIYGTVLLMKAVASKVTLKSFSGKTMAIIVPLVILIASYILLLREYEADWAAPLVTLLDFGYPLGQALYLALAALVYLLSRKYLGGLMRPAIFSLLLALGVQYLADFMFVYTHNNETWTTAGTNDFTYLVAYFAMTLALIKFKTALQRISADNSTPEESEEA